ncbi:MAG: hypothetical protein ABIS06_13265 [Vicinamibacterales bacterium]
MMRQLSFRLLLACLAFATVVVSTSASSSAQRPDVITTSAFKADVDAFFDREIPSHLAAIPKQGELPDRVHGALTTGEFSWGTFVRALAAYAETRGSRTVAGRDVVPLVARVGVSESARGSKAFAQLYAALALRHFGADLNQNPLWQSLSGTDRTAWKSLLDPRRFYDPATRRVIDLPENYLGVASRVATLAYQMRVLEDRPFVDALLDRAAEPFTGGALYADDAGTTGRYDRYSNEYARYVYEAADTMKRQDIMAALQPSLKAQMRLWWDLVSPDGYGYQWGRSLGVVSYLDTLEIVAFLARHPSLRPAPLADLTAEYRLSWNWLSHDYDASRHMLSIFAPGRGNYSYISKEREWQQTVGFFGKALMAHDTLMRVLATERVASFPARPNLPSVARFEFFRRGDRPAGVWLVRQGHLQFALPITTGTTPGVADYLPAPHGLPGFAVPVEQVVPAGASFFELSDGSVLVTGDGADQIVAAADGRSLRATWRRFAVIGSKSGEWIEPGFQVGVEWRIEGSSLSRRETITAGRDIEVKRLAFMLPSTATRHSDSEKSSGGDITLSGPEGTLTVRASGDLPFTTSVTTIGGEEPLGRGARGGVPIHVTYEISNLQLQSGKPRSWTIRLDVSDPAQRTKR